MIVLRAEKIVLEAERQLPRGRLTLERGDVEQILRRPPVTGSSPDDEHTAPAQLREVGLNGPISFSDAIRECGDFGEDARSVVVGVIGECGRGGFQRRPKVGLNHGEHERLAHAAITV